MEFNLRGIDLNLLPVFEAAYEERSLSRAALRLAMTQPAVKEFDIVLLSIVRANNKRLPLGETSREFYEKAANSKYGQLTLPQA